MILVKYTLKKDQSQANPLLMIPPNINKHTAAYIEQYLFYIFYIFDICWFRFSISSRDIAMLLRLSARAAFTSFHLKAFVSSMLLHQQLEEEEGECEVFLVL